MPWRCESDAGSQPVGDDTNAVRGPNEQERKDRDDVSEFDHVLTQQDDDVPHDDRED